jgi:acetyl-CoA C-acetyltransferase
MTVFVADACRTAIGAFGGALSSISAHILGSHLIKHLIANNNLDSAALSEIIMGQVLVSGKGQNPARQAAIEAGVEITVPAWMNSQVCGSGLRAVSLAAQAIKSGDADLIIAGGQENMSLAEHSTFLRKPTKMGNCELKDTMVIDGLWDAFNNYHMGITAENLAKKYNISRQEADIFAMHSQNKAEQAQKVGLFDNEIVPVNVFNGKEVASFNKDEYIRYNTTIDSLSKLKPAFDKNGVVTAGNSSGINDGAGALLIANEESLKRHLLNPLVRIVSYAHSGVDPQIMGIGPVGAVQKALKIAGWKISDLDLIESNEAFAVQALSVQKELAFDPSIVNVNGGAIALGHPIGASGARILVTLIHEMKRRGAKKALATMCVGGGMGVAICLET